jgi:hypothetical protein
MSKAAFLSRQRFRRMADKIVSLVDEINAPSPPPISLTISSPLRMMFRALNTH